MNRLLIIFVLTLGLSTACTRTQPGADPSSTRLALTISQSNFIGESFNDQLASRATETAFQKGDSIGLFVHTTSTVAAAGNHSSNVKYVTTEATTWQSNSGLEDILVQGCKVTGYYPYKHNVTDPTAIAHSVATNQSAAYDATKAGALELSDFMITAPAAVTGNLASAPAVALTFDHKLAKLVVGVGVPRSIDGVGVVGVESVTIKNLNTKCVINLATGTIGSLSDVADITPRLIEGTGAAGAASKWEAIVVPQTVAAGTLMVQIVCTMEGGVTKDLTYTVPAATPLDIASGKKLTIMLSSSAEVAITKEIEPVDGFVNKGLELGLTATANAQWTLSSSEDWITFSTNKASGYASSLLGTGTGSEQIVYVTVAANSSTTAMRSAVITLSDAYGATTTHEVVQDFPHIISISDNADWLDVSKFGGSKTIKVDIIGATTWTATVLDGAGNVSTDVTVTPNTGGDEASAKLTWSANMTNAAKSNYKIKFYLTDYPDEQVTIKTNQVAGPA